LVFDGSTTDPIQKAVRDATIAFMAATAHAQAEATKAAQKAGIAYASQVLAPHGHVAAVATARKISLKDILGPGGNRCRDLALAMLVWRILDPVSKLATACALSPATASSSLGDVDDDELYTALDQLLVRQPAIKAILAMRHLTNGTLVLYDVSSSYMVGSCCSLAKRGYSRDGKKARCRSSSRDGVHSHDGLLCTPDGCPVAIEVFNGNTGDPNIRNRDFTGLAWDVVHDATVVADPGKIDRSLDFTPGREAASYPLIIITVIRRWAIQAAAKGRKRPGK